MIDYTNCGDTAQPTYLDSSKYNFEFSTSYTNAAFEPPAYSYQNVSSFLDPTWQNPNNLTIKRCQLDFSVPETMSGPIFMYYRLTNFYQNHRQYIKNYDSDQLDGSVVSTDTLNTNCGPMAINSDNNLVVYPCGLIANSMFNGKSGVKNTLLYYNILTPISILDTASDLTSLDSTGSAYTFQRTGIAWPTDKQKYKVTSYQNSAIVPPPNWALRYPGGKYTDQYPAPDLSNMERLMVWMHTAALPDFRKIWARNDKDTLNTGRWRVSIDLSKVVFMEEGKKGLETNFVLY